MECFDAGVVKYLDKKNKFDFDVDIKHSFDECFELFSFHTPWNSFLREPWMDNLYYTMVIRINLAGLIPMSTSLMTTNRKTQ